MSNNPTTLLLDLRLMEACKGCSSERAADTSDYKAAARRIEKIVTVSFLDVTIIHHTRCMLERLVVNFQ